MIILMGYVGRFVASFFLWIEIYALAYLLAREKFSIEKINKVDYLIIFITAVIQMYQLPELQGKINPGLASSIMCILFSVFLRQKLKRSILWGLGVIMVSNLLAFPVQMINGWWIPYFDWDFAMAMTIFYYPFQLIVVYFLYQFLSNSNQTRLLIVIQNVYSRLYKILAGVFISMMIYLIFISVQMTDSQSRFDFDIYISIGFALLSVPVFMVIIGYIDYQNKQLKAKSEYMKTYSISLEMLYHEMRAYRHDIDNILLSIKLMIEEGKLDDLKCYFEDKIESLSGVDVDLYNLMMSLEMITDHAVKSLMLSKLKKAKSLGLDIEICIDELTEFYSIADIDMCRILGILLDNAIEAASTSDEKSLSISIKHYVKSIDVSISNSMIGEVNSIQKLGSKERGIGLKSLEAILRRNEHVKLKTFISNSGYEQVISFHYI